MIRRRHRRQREIAFGLDSFLDVITNVIGIIIRMILVVWIGARAYHAMQFEQAPPEAPANAPIVEKTIDDPLQKELAEHERQLESARNRLLAQMRLLPALQLQEKSVQGELTALDAQRSTLAAKANELDKALGDKKQAAEQAKLDLVQWRERHEKLLQELKALEADPLPTRALYYRTPVSRPVADEELFFECRDGRVAFVDIGAFIQEMRIEVNRKADLLRQQWQFEGTTKSSGAFRMRYTIARRKDAIDNLLAGAGPVSNSGFSYGLKQWIIEPILDPRGESIEEALKPRSEFRQIVDHVDPRLTVVTFWVYPDSFALFRQLRDYLYERNIEVAGRPLPMSASIRGSPHGTASRGQ